MPLVATDAVVLHVFDYSETSRILRIATLEAGVVAVLARGARRPKSRFGSAVDLFAQGAAQLSLRDGRDLQTLTAFEVTRARPEIGADLERFTGAAALAELMLRFGSEDVNAPLFTTLVSALDTIADALPSGAREAGLAGAWRLVADMGFAPALEACGACDVALAPSADATFSHDAGGVLCTRCARLHAPGRSLPAAARSALTEWLAARRLPELDERDARAHQRLLREFLGHHLADGRSLRAFEVWEHGGWAAR